MNKVLEITTVITRKNINDIEPLVDLLYDIGVRRYSIHRAIPVGRMYENYELVPTTWDYIQILINVAKLYFKYDDLDIHMHHTIESIWITLLLGESTYVDKIGNPDIMSSLGITPYGDIVFDPWCMVKPWSKLKVGNILTADLDKLLFSTDSLLQLAKAYTAKNVRCFGCPLPCSGGSRVTASASYLKMLNKKDATLNELLYSFVHIDPACPLSKYFKRGDNDV